MNAAFSREAAAVMNSPYWRNMTDEQASEREELIQAIREADSMKDIPKNLRQLYKQALKACDQNTATSNTERARDEHGRFTFAGGFTAEGGVKAVKKDKDYKFNGQWNVTLDNGDVHGVYRDKDSGTYRHANPKGTGVYDNIVSTTKSGMLDDLIKRQHLFNPHAKEAS